MGLDTMFEARFFIDGLCVFVLGCWPLLVIIAAAAIRNVSRVSKFRGARGASSPMPTLARDLVGSGPAGKLPAAA